MVSSIHGSHSSSILSGVSPHQTTPSGSMASFTDQLAAQLEQYLAKSGNNSNLEIDIQTTPSQNSGVRQFIVTVKTPDSTPAQAAVPPNPAASASPSLTSAPAPASPTPTSAPAPASSAPVAPVQANVPMDDATKAAQSRAEIEAYWVAQPPAVQQLRNVPDFGARSAMAQQLADQGYTIDKAIMVWGWDPMKTMLTRQMYGYTWVPNINQSSVSPGPGFALAGQTPYDPSNPPPGSIAVNTDFMNGLNITDPWA